MDSSNCSNAPRSTLRHQGLEATITKNRRYSTSTYELATSSPIIGLGPRINANGRIFYMAVSLQGLVAIPSAHLPPKLQPGRSETDETMMRTRRAQFPSRDAQRHRSPVGGSPARGGGPRRHAAHRSLLVHTAETVGSVGTLVERTV